MIASVRRLFEAVRRHALEGAITALSAVLVLTLLVSIVGRITHPFCLEWMEGAMVDHVARVTEGERIYVPPSLQFVPFVYPPVFYWLSAAMAVVTGLGFLPLRIVSVLATLGTIACVVGFVRREGAGWRASMVAGALFAGTFPLSGFYFDVGRVDALSVCFALGSAYMARFGRGFSAVVGAALLLTLAYHTKQSSLVLGLPMIVYLMRVDRRRGLWFVGVLGGLVLGTSIVLDTVHEGWFGYYTHRVVSGHAVAWEHVVPFVRGEILYPFGLALAVGSWVFLSRTPTGRENARLFHGLLFAGLLVMAGLGRVHTGGWINVLMPLHAGIAILVGLGLHAARSDGEGTGRRAGQFVTLMVVVQLGVLLWDPRPSIPTEGDRAAGRTWLDRVRSVPGPVWTTHRGHLTWLAGKDRHAHMMAMHDVMRSNADFGGAKSRLTADVEGAISSGRFDLVVMDNRDFWYLPALERHYERDTTVWFEQPDVFWPRAGARLRPELGYVRKGSSDPEKPPPHLR